MAPFINVPENYRVMEFKNLIDTAIIDRPNRFIVRTELNNNIINVHLHDPGRLEELIYGGNHMLIREAKGKKTNYSVTFIRDGDIYTFNDARFHSEIASKFIKDGYRKEVKVNDSRIDFRYNNSFIEVKSCTLVEDGIAKFPDAKTARGRKHLMTLMDLIKGNYKSYVLFLIFNENACCFLPNSERDPDFAKTFYEAYNCGVKFKFLVFYYKNGSIYFKNEIKLCDG